MSHEVKIHTKRMIDAFIYTIFYIIILFTTAALAFNFIERSNERSTLKMEIQKKNVQIEALLILCQMDYLIKIRRPDLGEGNEIVYKKR